MLETGTDQIHVLIVDDIPETRENLKKLLFFEKDIEVVGTATTGKEAIELSVELKPAVVLMDINMPDMDGISATKTILEKVPGVQVIMMSVQGEMSYVRESMRAGAREFLIKPFTSDELLTSIRRVYELRPAVPVGAGVAATGGDSKGGGGPGHRARFITVFGAKGGAGCSTVVTNLACALKAEKNVRVALWDTNFLFGDVGVLLNIQPSRSIVDLIPRIDDLDAEFLNNVMLSHSSGVRVLLAPPEPQYAESIRINHLERILEVLRMSYDYVFIDTWTSLYDQVLAMLDAADRVVTLVTPEIPAIKNTRLFLDIAERLGYSAEKIMLVLNKWDRRSGIRPEKLQGTFNHQLDAVIPLDDRVVLSSINQGVPFVTSYKAAPISQSIFELVKRLVQELEPETGDAEVVGGTSGRGQAGRLSGLLR